MLDRLEARGLIKRERQTDDRRVVLTYITKAGVELLAGLDRPVTDLHKRQLRSLTKKELETLASLLTKLAAATK
jgi:DNA-binding MarR family transcriptional regulator